MLYARLLIPVLFILGTLLSACAEQRPTTPPLDFETSPYILRGFWMGMNGEGDTLLLDLAASDPSAEGYRVTGTFQLNDDEPVVIEGYHKVRLTVPEGAVSVLASPVDPFVADTGPNGWYLSGYTPAGSPPSFAAYVEKEGNAQYFDMTAQGDTELLGTEWTLETLLGKRLIEGSTITLEFNDASRKRFGGSDGCNYYFAGYTATATTLDIESVGATEMACEKPAGVMAQAEVYVQILFDATTYRIAEGRLEIMDAAGTQTLVFKAAP